MKLASCLLWNNNFSSLNTRLILRFMSKWVSAFCLFSINCSSLKTRIKTEVIQRIHHRFVNARQKNRSYAQSTPKQINLREAFDDKKSSKFWFQFIISSTKKNLNLNIKRRTSLKLFMIFLNSWNLIFLLQLIISLMLLSGDEKRSYYISIIFNRKKSRRDCKRR